MPTRELRNADSSMKNDAASSADQIMGEDAAVLTVLVAPQLNNFSNKPLHSLAKQKARRREFMTCQFRRLRQLSGA
jgi:hypothetical protein